MHFTQQVEDIKTPFIDALLGLHVYVTSTINLSFIIRTEVSSRETLFWFYFKNSCFHIQCCSDVKVMNMQCGSIKHSYQSEMRHPLQLIIIYVSWQCARLLHRLLSRCSHFSGAGKKVCLHILTNETRRSSNSINETQTITDTLKNCKRWSNLKCKTNVIV